MKHIKVYESHEAGKSYHFEELSPQAKEKVLDDFRDINVDRDWWECTIDSWKEKLEEMGVEDPEIAFSGFYSQGDGASFTGRISDPKKWVTEVLGLKYPDEVLDRFSVRILRDHGCRYSHENSVDLYVETEGDEEVIEEFPLGFEVPFQYVLSEISEKIEKAGDEWRKDLCREIYRELEDEYDDLTSDAAVMDTIEANGYEFDEKGNQI